MPDTSPLTIALVLPGFSANPNDWAIPALQNLARCLTQNCRLHVFSQRYPSRGVYQFDGLTHHALGGGQRFGPASLHTWLATSRAIVRQHRRTPFDLLHAFWADEAGFSAVLAGAILRRPVIVSLGGGELTRLTRINYGAQRFWVRRFTTRLALQCAAAVTAGSHYQLALCRDHGVATRRLHHAPLGVDTQRFTPTAPPTLPLAPTIVQAASLLAVKNQPLLLDVIRRIAQELPAVQLHLAGDGPARVALQALARQLGLVEHVVWRGAQPYSQMPAFFRQGQLYLQSSRHESQGMAALEAMACGLPLLGTPVGVAAEVAALPAASCPATLAAQTLRLLTDEPLYRHCARQAVERVRREYSLPAAAARFEALYAILTN